MKNGHRSFAGKLGCGLLLGLLALQATPTAQASFNIYVVNAGDNNVVVFNSEAQTARSTFPVGRDPSAISISPDGSRAYVVDFADSNVALLFPVTVPTTFISVGRFPVGIAITPDGAYAYVTNRESSSVSVIATATNQVVKTILLASGSGPGGIAIIPDGTRAYVTKQFSGDVSVIDTATNLEVTGAGFPIPVAGATGITITPDGTRAYVANAGSQSVSVIDTGLNQVVGDPIPVGLRPVQIAITPDGTHAYVTNEGSDSVSVIDTGSNQVTTVTGGPPSMSHPAGIAIDQDGTFAYVSNAALDSVSVINTGSNTVVGDPIRVGRDPVAIAILRHSNFINPLTAVWKGGSVFNMQGLLTTFTAPVDNPSLVASVTWDFYGDDSVVQTTATTSTQFTYTRAGLFRPTVTVTLTDGTRASAITTMRVQSPAEAIATTVSLVNWLDLPAGATTSLVVQLDGASDAVTRGNIYAACGELHAFENEVQALVQSSRLDQSGAAPRLGEAQAIRFSLGCS